MLRPSDSLSDLQNDAEVNFGSDLQGNVPNSPNQNNTNLQPNEELHDMRGEMNAPLPGISFHFQK